LYAPNTTEYASVATQLQRQWRAVGIDVHVVLQDETDFQSTITLHTYDALLYASRLVLIRTSTLIGQLAGQAKLANAPQFFQLPVCRCRFLT